MESHLLQMRGLKPDGQYPYTVTKEVASFTDAWIETLALVFLIYTLSRIFYRCVDWNDDEAPTETATDRRIFYRCVDWNL